MTSRFAAILLLSPPSYILYTLVVVVVVVVVVGIVVVVVVVVVYSISSQDRLIGPLPAKCGPQSFHATCIHNIQIKG